MKQILLTVTDFLLFRQIAEKYRVLFTYGPVKAGEIKVQAAATDLEMLGY